MVIVPTGRLLSLSTGESVFDHLSTSLGAKRLMAGRRLWVVPLLPSSQTMVLEFSRSILTRSRSVESTIVLFPGVLIHVLVLGIQQTPKHFHQRIE